MPYGILKNEVKADFTAEIAEGAEGAEFFNIVKTQISTSILIARLPDRVYNL